MASWSSFFSRWHSPINNFPSYHGPFAVGTVDVEIPVADLPSTCESVPEGAQPTVSFRIFYPCTEHSEAQRSVRWIQQPQKEQVRALVEFLGVGNKTSWLSATLLRHLYWISLPAHRNAKMLRPSTSEGRWPVTMFSHGLAGNRNSYSFICGNLASYGTVVIAPDHRDGSSPLQHVRATKTTQATTLRYIKYSHEPTKEVWNGRDKMLRVRLWEIACIYEALLKIDGGEKIDNLDSNKSWDANVHNEVLQQFKGSLDVHRPGKVTWAGHSFGAATSVQLLKSVFYASKRPSNANKPLIITKPDATIAKQITPDSPTLLLDMWNLPLLSPDQSWLKELPLPSYAPNGQGGNNVLAVLSEAFYKWQANLEATKHVVAPPSGSRGLVLVGKEEKGQKTRHAALRDESPNDSGYASSNVSTPHSRAQSPPSASTSQRPEQSGPHVFYPERSQHFSQSDFGILFPWVTSKLTKTEEPENILKLNTRAMVQVMRQAGIEMAGSEWNDTILKRESGAERRWIAVPIDDNGDISAADDEKLDMVDQKLQQHAPEAQMPEDPSVAAIQ